MKIIRYSVRNPMVVNIFVIAASILGIISLFQLPRELAPKIAFNYVFIIVPYPGVVSEEVEKLITIPIEDAVSSIEDVKMMSSESSEGSAFVWLQFEDISATKFQQRMNEVETAVKRVQLPEGALDPVIEDFDTDNFIPVISVSLAGDMSEKQLYALADALRDDILRIKGISQVSKAGMREREIWIEVDPVRLNQHNLSLTQIVNSIKSRNLNIPAGELVSSHTSRLVRTIGEVSTPEEFAKVVVRLDPRGNHLHLGKIANIKDHWADETTRSRMDGEKSVTLSITKKASANSLDIIREVKRLTTEHSVHLPKGAKYVFTNDNSIYIRDILNKLQTNALLGFLLVVAILFVFMGLRNSLVAAVGIPVSFLITFFLMQQTGQTFNGHALFGLILVLGVVVDDAIIVVENCYRHWQRGLNRSDAAIFGTTEVFWPVVSATLTTIAAFSPLMLMTGLMGKFMRIIPFIFSLALLASLIEVFFIAPSHFVEWGGKRPVVHRDAIWFRKLRHRYTKALIWLMRRRYFVGPAIFVLMLLLSMMIPILGVELYHGDEFSQFVVNVTMPPGATLAETDRVMREVEKQALQLRPGETHAVITNTGMLQESTDWIYADNVGQLTVDLVEKDFRERSMNEIMDDMRARIKPISGPIEMKVIEVKGGPPMGKSVEIKVKGKHFDELSVVAEKVKSLLSNITGVHDVGDDNLKGKQEIRLIVDENRAAQYGLPAVAIAQEVRTAVTGSIATVFRDGDESIDVRVKLSNTDNLSLEQLKSLTIPTPTGVLITLGQICSIEKAPTMFRVKRFERERSITVTAEVDKRKTTAIKVNQEVERQFKDIALAHPGYSLDFRGEFKEFTEAFGQLINLFLLGVIFIFTILSAQFKSVRQSFIILLTIPFAFIGSVIGQIVGNNPFTLFTMYGMVALAGIAVNDAIVMVSFINDSRNAGGNRWLSIIRSGRVRLRPIILTSMTTILGLMPMAIGIGGKSDTWQPLANTIAWGLGAATILTLLVIPVVYTVVVDEWFGISLIKQRRAKKMMKKVVY